MMTTRARKWTVALVSLPISGLTLYAVGTAAPRNLGALLVLLVGLAVMTSIAVVGVEIMIRRARRR
jgi:hypothetical protein